VLFDSSAVPEDNALDIARVLSEGFGIYTNVIVRTAEELFALLGALPLCSEEFDRAQTAHSDVECLYAFFFPSALADETKERFLRLASGSERLAFIGTDAYLLLDGSIRLSKLAAALQKPVLGGTARSQKTLLALADLAWRRTRLV